uniref:GNAT family N-acetyltransferase n=1 Tax=Paenibacillus sp. IHBB 10380 TaxID=1566358 RepID=UPI001F36958E|nr:GNAT family N-acetyltransferase [Paenibacillus sp. IHBB 10380]
MLNLEIDIKPLDTNGVIPYDLLLLADPSKMLIDSYIDKGICYLAKHKSDIIGEFVLIHTHPQTVEIVNIAVKETYQGQGIGRKLIIKAIEVAKQFKATSIEIGTGNSSIQQLRLYQKCGFRITGIDHDFFIRNYEEEIFEDGIQCKDMIRLSMGL